MTNQPTTTLKFCRRCGQECSRKARVCHFCARAGVRHDDFVKRTPMRELAKAIYLQAAFVQSAYVTRNNFAAYQASKSPWLTAAL